MKVYIAVMLDEEEVSDHNCPTVLLAASESILLSKIREHVKLWDWLLALDVNIAEIDTMSVEQMNEKLDASPRASMYIHLYDEEV